MTRSLNKLNAPKVRTCGPGKYSDGGGLRLVLRRKETHWRTLRPRSLAARWQLLVRFIGCE